MNTKIRKEIISGQKLQFISETYQGEMMDTIVNLNGLDLMVIAGTDIEDFIKAFKNLMAYKI